MTDQLKKEAREELALEFSEKMINVWKGGAR